MGQDQDAKAQEDAEKERLISAIPKYATDRDIGANDIAAIF